MHPSALKLTAEIAADIRARVKSLDFGAIEKNRKAKEENGTFDVIISTEDIDRAGEIVKQNGWELTNYKDNPIVLWGHDYYSLPIGVCLETYETTVRGLPALGARGVFLSADINPFAQQVRKLYDFGLKQGAGVGCTTSVGFIPKEFDENARNTITKAELLEFSFVPVPANQGVGPAQGRALTFAEARELGLDMVGMHTKGVQFAELRGSIPDSGTSNNIAPADTKWVKPALSDFTKKSWADLTLEEKMGIASHFAYSKDAPAAAFEDLKLPYRSAKDATIVLNGLKAAMNDLIGARSGVDVEGDQKAVYEHLAAQYKLFGKKAPEFASLKEAQAGDHCSMDDGTPGILSGDPKDPDGPLVCIPQEQDKSAEGSHASQKELIRAAGDEHARHAFEVGKSFDAYQRAMEGADSDEAPEHMKDLRSALQDEHTMHRAKCIACFRAFDPSENKTFDKNDHLKALRDEHDGYEAKNNKALDKYEEKCTKSFHDGVNNEHDDWFIGKMEDNQYAHKKSVMRIAKSMCKSAFGEEDQADEKTLEILKEFLTPHIDAQLLPVVTGKIGQKLASEANKKLSEAHQLLKAATAVVESLNKGLGESDGEDNRSDAGQEPAATVPQRQRSRPAGDTSAKSELDAHLFTRDVLREIATTATSGLEKIKKDLKAKH